MAAATPPKALACARCGVQFLRSDTGTFGCFVHLQLLDQETGHFPCCGASADARDCSLHLEAHDPPGCHRVDHTATAQELKALLCDAPYTVTPLSKAPPRVVSENGVVVFKIDQQKCLDHPLMIPVPHQWRGPSEATTTGERVFCVDVRGEHQAVQEAVQAAAGAKSAAARSTDPYTYDPLLDTNMCFEPFALVLRLSATSDPHRTSAIGSSSSCTRWKGKMV